LAIDEAVGSKAPSPSFVTADFVRAGNVQFDWTDAADAGPRAGDPFACPSGASLRARITFTAKNYTQAMQKGPDHCPSVPISR
jgi:hypothetical protein